MIGDGSINIGFGKLPGYTAPGWPGESAPKRYHLDLYVDDLDEAEQQALALERPQAGRDSQIRRAGASAARSRRSPV